MVAAPLRLAALQRVGDARNASEIESCTSMVLGLGKYGRELHSGSLVANNHGSRPYATTLICPEICPKDIKYWYRVLEYGFGCLLRISGLIHARNRYRTVLYEYSTVYSRDLLVPGTSTNSRNYEIGTVQAGAQAGVQVTVRVQVPVCLTSSLYVFSNVK